MKAKPTRIGGRKKFSAGKQISPELSISENLLIAAVGEFASDRDKAKYFNIAARVVAGALTAGGKFSAATDAASKKKWHDDGSKFRGETALALYDALAPAFASLNPKPFRQFAAAIEMLEEIRDNGLSLPDFHEALRVCEEMNLKLGANVVQKIKPKDFKAKLSWTIDERQFNRIKKLIGLHFPTGRPPKD